MPFDVSKAQEVDDYYLPPVSGPERLKVNVREAPALSGPTPACAPAVKVTFGPGL
jgi:hypothetical protein